MKQRLGLFVILAIFLTGCGAKKRASNSNRDRRPHQTTVSRTTETSSQSNMDSKEYPLPKDEGSFVRFPIATTQEYIETFAEIAKFEMKAYGIPASITLAQGILESGGGRGALTMKTNNHFGIKCHTNWNGDYDYHDDDEKGECFRKYNHPMYSFRDHSEFLSSRARYASLFELDADDYKGWAQGLSDAGYATDKRYPQKLISFIEQYGLHIYDQDVASEGYTVKKESKNYDYKVHVVTKGDTLYSISRKYFVSVNDLMKMNRISNSDLAIGQEVIVKSEKIKK
ncbi:glucosaminidase domain-containing protein [Sediminicola arcticus]|jgi:flagellum-specific peptidoglycan hydrolase FlgJ|uniref:Peptidoglycan hydrolase n=1 Tax=Sediminicola arcticus TaxID=1574308 RepID=A0ABV2SYS7_9FLAO